MLGLGDGNTALKVTLNMVWVDLVKMCGEGGQGGGAKALSAQAGVLSGNSLVSLPLPSPSAPVTLESVTSLGTQMHKGNNPSVSHSPEGKWMICLSDSQIAWISLTA